MGYFTFLKLLFLHLTQKNENNILIQWTAFNYLAVKT